MISSESDGDTPMASSTPAFPRGPKPKYHTSITGHVSQLHMFLRMYQTDFECKKP